MAALKMSLIVLALVAMAAVARADDGPKVDAAHSSHKTIVLYGISPSIAEIGNDTTAARGDTGVIVQKLSETPGGSPVGVLRQTGIYTEVGSVATAMLNYQLTITLEDGYDFHPGKIFAIGDGTGIQDPGFLQKAVVGGTGPYTHAEGKITRDGSNPYVIHLW